VTSSSRICAWCRKLLSTTVAEDIATLIAARRLRHARIREAAQAVVDGARDQGRDDCMDDLVDEALIEALRAALGGES
jgi:hypothetical protein